MAYSEIAIFSFFSGSGFLDLGFEKAGYSIEFVNEYSRAFLNAYQYSRLQMKHPLPKYGYWNTDINEYLNFRSKELHSFISDAKSSNHLIGFIGGPPCPDFSVGGKNRGRNGENGKLSLSYVNLILEMRPDFFLFENVKGLWRTERHRAFYEELKSKLYEAGYVTTERLTNALEFGVPQDRDRILLFGVSSSLLSKQHYQDHEIKDFPWEANVSYALSDVKNIEWPNEDAFCQDGILEKPQDIIDALTVQYWFDKNNVESHANNKAFFQPRNGLIKMQSIPEGDVSKKSYKRLHRWRYSPTAAYGNNEVHLHPYKARRLSASEAMSIQSLPPEFVLPPSMSLSDMFKTIGNGVPLLLSEGIAKTIRNYLEVVVCKE